MPASCVQCCYTCKQSFDIMHSPTYCARLSVPRINATSSGIFIENCMGALGTVLNSNWETCLVILYQVMMSVYPSALKKVIPKSCLCFCCCCCLHGIASSAQQLIFFFRKCRASSAFSLHVICSVLIATD